jgi:hypothetical protein
MPFATRTRAFIALACLVTVGLLCAAPALAVESEVERTIAFIELREGPDSSSLTVDYLKEVQEAFNSANKGDYIHVSLKNLLEKMGKSRSQLPRALTDERRAMLSEGKEKGIAYLHNADTVNAIKALSSIASKYRAALAAPGVDDKLRKEYLEILAHLATGHILAKERDKAEDVFRLVVTTFGTEANVTDDFYRPDVVEVFKKVVKDVQSLEKGKIDVASMPRGADIIVNGHVRGKTPGTVRNLIPGVYSVHLVQGSNTSMLHRVRVDGGKATKVHIDLPLESHLALDNAGIGLSYKDSATVHQRVPVDALSLGRLLEVNLVVAMGVIDRKLVSYVVDVSFNRVVRHNSIAVPQVGVSKRAIQRTVTTIMGAGKSAHPQWYTYQPGWYVAGGGLVSLGVGLALSSYLSGKDFYLCPDLENPCANPSEAFRSKAVDAQSSYETKRYLSSGGLVLGVLLGGASAYMFYSHSNAGSLALSDVPAPSKMAATLPPINFGSAPTAFTMGL